MMRIRHSLLRPAAALLFAAALLLSCHQAKPRYEDAYSPAAQRLLPSASLRDSVSYLLGVNFATMLNYGGGGTDGDDFGPIDFQRVKEGIDDFLAADREGCFMDYVRNGYSGEGYDEFVQKLDIDPALTDSIILVYIQARMDARARDNQEKGRDFFEENRDQGGIREAEVRYPNPENVNDTLTAQIQYKLRKSGAGPFAALGDSLLLSYRAYKLGNENPFDQVDSLGVSALTDSTFLRGFTAGLQKMRSGDEATFYIPSELGFGLGRTAEGRSFFSPYATLIFEVALHAIVSPAVEEEEPENEEKK